MEIKEYIKDYIQDKCIGDYLTKYVVDVEKLCNILGITILEEELINRSSNIRMLNGEKFIIEIDTLNAPSEKGRRYVIAHQLGHYFSYMCGSYSKEKLDKNIGCTWKFENIQEYCNAEVEAHLIASYLLMPEEMVKHFMEWRIPINEMADKFNVTLNVAKKRLKTIHPYYFELFSYPENGIIVKFK